MAHQFGFLPLLAFFVALVIAYVGGPVIVGWLRRLSFGQEIREEGPEAHLSKAGTPTMGGFIFIIPIALTPILFQRFDQEALVVMACFILFGLIGFIDDFVKVGRKHNLGLRAYQKILLQLLFAALLAYLKLQYSPTGSQIIVPFTKQLLDPGILYYPFEICVIVGTVNSVNLTDGLDGLASTVTIIVTLFLAAAAFVFQMTTVAILMLATAGALLGFLRMNMFPAKTFMGDTGSMALGGLVAGAAVLLNIELLIPIIGFVYFMESVSVILQVASFKSRGKRIFKMTPIHHHFELSGMHETKVVNLFTLLSLAMAVIAAFAI